MEIQEQITRLNASAAAHTFLLEKILNGWKVEDVEKHCFKMLNATVEQLKILNDKRSVDEGEKSCFKIGIDMVGDRAYCSLCSRAIKETKT